MSNKKFIDGWRDVINGTKEANYMNCGSEVEYGENDVEVDEMEKHIKCSSCGATFDVE